MIGLNYIESGKLERMFDMDLELYASKIVDQLIRIKDNHRDILMADEINTLNAACNIIYHNRKVLVKE